MEGEIENMFIERGRGRTRIRRLNRGRWKGVVREEIKRKYEINLNGSTRE